MTTQIDVVDVNDNTNGNADETPVEEIKPEEVKPKATPRAKTMVKEVLEADKPKAKPRAKAKTKVNEEEVEQEEVI